MGRSADCECERVLHPLVKGEVTDVNRQQRTAYVIGLLTVLCGWLASPGAAAAADIAWDLVNSTNQNLVSYTTDAPVFSAAGDGFQKYDIDVDLAAIPYSLLDDTAGSFPADLIGIIDSTSDHEEFFGATDTVNNDNPEPGVAYHATWVFNISTATSGPELSVDLAAMGDFEDADSFFWTYQVDAGPVVQVFTAAANVDGSLEYTMADGTTRLVAPPRVGGGGAPWHRLTPMTPPHTNGAQLTVVFTGLTDGGSEGYAVRNLKVTAAPPPAVEVQVVNPTFATGIATADAGIASLALTGASNLSLTSSGAVGATQWTWQVDLVDTALPGSGTLVVTASDSTSGSAAINLSGTAVQIIVQSQTDIEIRGIATADAGIASLVLTGSNLALTTSGAVGANEWTWQVNIVDPASAGTGLLELTDSAGGSATLAINLRGFGAAPIPALDTSGIVVLVLLLALGGVAVLRFGRH